MFEPFVSVVINNYNYDKYLKEAIESALNQSYGRKEIIVVDDGSTDSSREIIKSYGNRIIPVLKNNGGQASAMNAGFRFSKGDWVCFLDSDDVWLPEKISKVVETTKKNPDAVMIYHRIQPISSSGDYIEKPIPLKPFRGNIEKIVLRSGGWWMYPPNSALCFRRDFLEKVMDIPEDEFKICADAYLADLAPFFGEVDFVDDVLALYRFHGSNYWKREESLKETENSMISFLKMYEKRVNSINRSLERMGIEKRVSLENHWPYQRLKFILGLRPSIPKLLKNAIDFPYHETLLEKLRGVAWIFKNILWKRRAKLK